MQPNKRTCLLALLVFLSLGLAASAEIKVGDSFPDLAAYKIEGTLPELAKGKVVMIDFWASWCGPCAQSFPVMEELQKTYGPQGLVIIAVSVDEKKADLEDFAKKHPVTFAIVRDVKQKLVAKAGISAMPSSFLIGKDGKVAFTHSGFHGSATKKQYESEIQSLLKSEAK
ncbi:MAG TPA: TlpA disulfide reductase family protein [Verrucomicrobiae bacterium]|nr:TlpA disulfide reductase family protein [Verrucomicrobiae bacterium]